MCRTGSLMVGLRDFAVEELRRRKLRRWRRVSLGVFLFHMFAACGAWGWAPGLWTTGCLGLWLYAAHWLFEEDVRGD